MSTSEAKDKPRHPLAHISNFKTIGEGTLGKGKEGVHNYTGEKVAIKILEKDKIKEIADVER